MQNHTRWNGMLYATGSALYALSVVVFSAPADIAPGGAAGLGVLANALLGVPMGLTILLINVPLLWAAAKKLSRRYALRSAVCLVTASVMMDVGASVVVPYTGDRLLAALCGGLLSGLGVGMIMMRGAGTGGSDIAALLLQKRWEHLSVGRWLLALDAAVIALSVPVYGELSAALYAAIQVFVSSTVIDRLVYGREEGRLLLVVTAYPQEVCRAASETIARGATIVRATGGYQGDQKALVLCAVNRLELPLLKRAVREVDERAFAMIVPTKQVVGEGFLVETD